MIFRETKLKGAYLIELEPHHDERGFFARSFCQEEFASRGLNPHVAQSSVSFNPRRGTLRGMHYQASPHEETKLIRCTRGAIFDVIIDLRRDSHTFKQYFAVELTAANRTMLYVPMGCAHGFQTLADDTEVFYQISTPYHQPSGRGVRWDDPAFAIKWPEVESRIISARDRNYKLFGE